MLSTVFTERQAQVQKLLRFARPLALLWGGAGLAAAFGAVAQFLFARSLGPAGYGVIVSANAVANILGPLAAFGVGLMLIQKYGGEGWLARRWVRGSLRVFVASAGIFALIYLAWSAATADTATERWASMLLAPLMTSFAAVQLAECRFQLEHRYADVARWQVLKHGAVFAVAVLTALFGWGLLGAAWGLALAASAVTAFAFWAGAAIGRDKFNLAGHGQKPAEWPVLEQPSARTLMTQAWPFAATSFVYLLFLQSSLAIVQALGGTHLAGLYGLPVSVMTAIYLLPRILYRNFLLAKVSRWHYHDRSRVAVFTQRIVPAVALATIPLAAALALLAPFAIPLAFGAAFAKAVPVLQILAIGMPFRFVSTGLAIAAVETRHLRHRVYWQLMVTVAAISLTLLVFPQYGIVGAAYVMLGAEIALALAYWVLARRADLQGPHPAAALQE